MAEHDSALTPKGKELFMESQFIELPSGLGIHMLEAGTQRRVA